MGKMVDTEMSLVVPSNIEQDGEAEALAPPRGEAGVVTFFHL